MDSKPSNRRALHLLLTACLASLGPACSDSSSSAAPQADQTKQIVDFLVREDVQLAPGGITDARLVDLDGDGREDLIEASAFEMAVRVGYGRADGGFDLGPVLAIEGMPADVEALDADGDGDLDIAVGSYGFPLPSPTPDGDVAYTLAVWANDGTGGFVAEPLATVQLASAPARLTGLPREGSSASDVIVPFPTLEVIHRYRLQGEELLLIGALPSLNQAFSAVAIDEGGDGDFELVAGEVNQVVIYRADGQGGLQSAEILLPAVACGHVCDVRDVDGDGLVDLQIAESAGLRAILVPNTPTGFGPPIEFGLIGSPSDVSFADIDGDGQPDLAATLFRDQALEVHLSDGPFSFGPGRYYGVGFNARSLSAVDLVGAPNGAGDGSVDFFCVNENDVSLVRNLGAGGALRAAQGVPLGSPPGAVAAGDLDGDGEAELLVGVLDPPAVLVLTRGAGGAYQQAATIGLPPGATVPTRIATATLGGAPGPGPDVLVQYEGSVLAARGLGGLAFEAAVPLASARDFAVEDLDGDGLIDLAVIEAGEAGGTLVTWRGTGDPLAFELASTTELGATPVALAVGGIDRDGVPDFAVGSVFSGTTGDGGGVAQLATFKGDGEGGALPRTVVPLAVVPIEIRRADFDGDGRGDFALVQPAADAILILRNAGKYAFETQVVDVGPGLRTALVFDVNVNGRPDLVIARSGGDIVVLLQRKNGNFALPAKGPGIFHAPLGVARMARADLTDDGDSELLFTSPLSPFLWIAVNLSQ